MRSVVTSARHVLRVALTLCLVSLIAGCGGGGGNRILTSNNVAPSATGLTVTPVNPSANVGAGVQFHATVTFSDGSTQDVTNVVTWTSSQPTVATVSNASGSQGAATAKAPGTTTISAVGAGFSSATVLTVNPLTPTQISVVPATSSVGVGKTEQLQAFATLNDGTQIDVTAQVTWSSNNAAVSVSNASGHQGVVTGVSAGTATITASGFGLTATASVTAVALTVVSVEVAPPELSLPLGTGDPLEATAVFSDGSELDVTSQAAWSSSDPSKATVDATGRVQSVAIGTTTITATFNGVSGTSTVTVTAPALTEIQVTPADRTVSKGVSVQYHATGIFSDSTSEDLTDDVAWSSTNGSAATISATGLASTVGVGDTTIKATFGAVTGDAILTVSSATLVSIAVTPANQQIPIGLTQQYTATGTLTDGTTEDLTAQATWSADPFDVLTISNAPGTQGLAEAVGLGQATVTATFNGISGSTLATGVSPVVTAVNITPSGQTLSVGMRQQFTATVVFSDGTTFNATRHVTWGSKARSIFRVSNGRRHPGRGDAASQGSTDVTATYHGVLGTAPVTVLAAPALAIEVTPNPAGVRVRRFVQFRAVAIIEGVFRVDITDFVLWTSSNTSVARISTLFDPGLAVGRSAGTSTITANFFGVTGTAQLTVSP